MTCRIDRLSIEQGLVLRISGRITGEDLDVLRTALEEGCVVAIDLTEVELVDRDAVKLLAQHAVLISRRRKLSYGAAEAMRPSAHYARRLVGTRRCRVIDTFV